ncbi:MAG: tRNA-(ms[2]io[6]A)-hydroxylase [Planctomycetales bacterium]|nr:tRNA-(ms[2]io[6]A)-hydroxylase [Planctomycetales bacterium]
MTGASAEPLEGLPLTRPTDPGWAAVALGDLPALLSDHAHCEQKAASSAMALVARHPEVPGLPRAMTALAHEEMRHFRQVLDLLEERGGTLGPPPPDAYAGRIRRLSCTLRDGLGSAGDLLLACAFIEARSCERFRLLAGALEDGAKVPGPRGLAGFYRRLSSAESRHWETFRDLAAGAAGKARVARRLVRLAGAEGEIVASLPLRPRIH